LQSQLEIVVDTLSKAYNTTCPGFGMRAASDPHAQAAFANLAPDVEEEDTDAGGIVVPAMPLHAAMAKAMITTVSKQKVTAAARKIGCQNVYPSAALHIKSMTLPKKTEKVLAFSD
jgi:hypothetical protein